MGYGRRPSPLRRNISQRNSLQIEMTQQSRAHAFNRASNDLLEATSFLSGANAGFVEQLYAQWLEDPESVEPSWQQWFAELGIEGVSQAKGQQFPFKAPSSGQDAELLGALTGLWPPRKSDISAADARSAAKGFRARHSDGARLSRDRASRRRSRSAASESQAASRAARSQFLRIPSNPILTGRSSSMACWASKRPRRGRW